MKECLVITKDKNFSLRAVVARRKSDTEISIIRTASSLGTLEDLPARISKVYSDLNPSEDHTVIIGTRLEGAFNVDIKTPKMPVNEIRNALSFELQRQIPLPIDSLAWCYRICSTSESSNLIRIFAVKADVWNNIVSILVQSGIKFDAFIYPAFCEDTGTDKYLDDLNHAYDELFDDFSRECPEQFSGLLSCSGTVFSGEELASDCGTLLCKSLCHHVLLGGFPSRVLSPLEVPASLRPVRFKFLKNSFMVFLLVNALLALVLCMRYSSDARRRMNELKAERTKANAEIFKIAQEDSQNRDIDELITKMEETDPGNPDIVMALLSLTQNIPPQLYASTFNAKGSEIELTLSSRKEEGVQSEASKLNSISDFSNVSIKNTRRDRDGSVTVYLKLTHNREGR